MAHLNAFAFEAILVADKPQSLTSSLFAPRDGVAQRAFITVEGDIRYRYDGGDPNSTLGHFCSNGSIVLNGEIQIKSFRAISNDVATLQVSYERV